MEHLSFDTSHILIDTSVFWPTTVDYAHFKSQKSVFPPLYIQNELLYTTNTDRNSGSLFQMQTNITGCVW